MISRNIEWFVSRLASGRIRSNDILFKHTLQFPSISFSIFQKADTFEVSSYIFYTSFLDKLASSQEKSEMNKFEEKIFTKFHFKMSKNVYL